MLMLVAAVAASVLAINAVFPAIARGSNALVSVSNRMDDQISSQINIVYATAELDKDGAWQDTDSDGYFDVTLWAKNIGSTRILGLDQMDVFFGKPGTYARIPYVTDAGASYPRWSYTLANGTEWSDTVTVKIAIHYQSALTSDTYLAKVITPSGAYAEENFSF